MAIYSGIITNGFILQSGDIATDVILTSGNIQVNSGGYAYNTTVNDRGSMHVNSGNVNRTTVNSGGNMYVNSGSANDTNVYSGGRITVNDSGTANSTIIYSGGSMYVRNNDTANSTTVKTGGIINGFSLQTDNFYSEGIHISNAIVSGSAILYSGQTANSTTIHYGGNMSVYTGAVNYTTIYSGGFMTVYYSGCTNNTIISGGQMHLGDGTASNTTIYSGGYMNISNSIATCTTIHSGGIMHFRYTGTANSTTIYSGGSMLFYTSETANNTTISGGYMVVGNGTTNTTAIYSGGSMSVGNATANNTTISGGYMVVSNGTANSTIVHSGGYMTLSSSTANNTTIYSGGSMDFFSSGTAGNTTVKAGGIINGFSLQTDNFYLEGIHISNAIVSGSATLYSKQTASSTTIYSGGRMDVHSSGTASGTTVSSGGNMIIYGSANSTTVSSGGSMLIYGSANSATTVCSGGSLRVMDSINDLVVMDGGYVDFSFYSKLNLSLAEKTASGNYLIAGTVTGTLNCTITVSENQTAGTYKLVRKMPKFIASVTLNAEEGNIGTLYTNGASVSYKENQYTLVYEGSSLSLVVAGPYAPDDTEAPSSPGNLSVTVSTDSAIVFWTSSTDNVGVTGYRLVLDDGSAIDVGMNLSYTIQNPTIGSHSVKVGAYDAAGNFSTYTTTTFLIEAADPEPGVDPTPKPDDPEPGVDPTPTPDDPKPGVDPTPTPDDPKPGVDPTPTPELPAAPDGTAVMVKKYNATFSWNKYSVAKGVKVKYQVMVDGVVNGKLSSGTKYTFKNAAVGNHAFAVRAVLSEKGKEDVYTAWSGNLTQYVADVTAPKTGKLSLVQTGEDSIRLSWTAAGDNVGVSRYTVTCGNETRELGSGILETEFHGKAGKVAASITAYDEAGNAGKTVKKTLNMKDMTAPTQVSGLRSEGVDNKSGGILAWNAASDNVGVTQYLISVEGGKTYKSKTNSVKVKKMAAGTYRYTVVALDKAKNQSIVSTAGEFTVADVIDPKIKKLSCKVNGQTALVSWNATDEVGIARSELWLDGARYADTTGLTSFSLGSLELGQHSVELKVWDAAGNDVFKTAKCNVTTPDQGLMTAAETALFRRDVTQNSGMIASL